MLLLLVLNFKEVNTSGIQVLKESWFLSTGFTVLKLHNFQEGKRLCKYSYVLEKLHMTLQWQRQMQMERIHLMCVHFGYVKFWTEVLKNLIFIYLFLGKQKILCWGKHLSVYNLTRIKYLNFVEPVTKSCLKLWKS